MNMEDRDESRDEISLPLPSSTDLRGRQSVRATFKLTEKAINTVSIVAAHLRIKQKSLFDHLLDDAQSLNLIADEIRGERFAKLNRVQKTYVISRKTITCLGEASRRLEMPRDALVEYSIRRLLPIIEEERKRHQKRKKILNEIDQYLKQGENILTESKKLLGEDDPVYELFQTAMAVSQNTQKKLRYFIERGELIEDY